MWQRAFIVTILLFCFTAAIYGCVAANRSIAPGGDITGDTGESVLNPLDDSMPTLPTVSALSKTTNHVVRYRYGLDYEKELPHSNVTQIDQVTTRFSPTGESSTDTAFAIYQLNLDELQSIKLQARWHTLEQGFGKSDQFIGLANFERNCWEWHEVVINDYLDVPDISDYRRDDGLFMVVVLLSGVREWQLYSVGFTSNELYDEIEPNNSEIDAQMLPPVPVWAFRGSLGSRYGTKAGYDGSKVDYFEINANDGDNLRIVFQATSKDMSWNSDYLTILNKSGVVLKPRVSSDAPGVRLSESFTYLQDQAPYLIRLQSNFLDYDLYVIEDSVDYLIPWSYLDSDVKAGPAPLQVTLDASGSYNQQSEEPITRYDWDFEGDGIWDVLGGTEPTIEFTYTTNGVYFPRLRVGNQYGIGHQNPITQDSEFMCTITVGESKYDEIEDNDGDNELDFNDLPAIPFTEFKGNIGNTWDWEGGSYDGDTFDCFRFEAEAGKPYSFADENFQDIPSTLTGDNVKFTIRDNEGNELVTTSEIEPCISFEPQKTGTYQLIVRSGRDIGSRDYSLIGLNKYQPRFFDITVDKVFGVAPLVVNASMTVTDGDSKSLNYQWALNSNTPDTTLGNEILETFILDSIGLNTIYAFATDETGLRAYSSREIYVWPHYYNEREDNSSWQTAQVLPALPIVDFKGNIAGPETGYDGSHFDHFILSESFTTGSDLVFSFDLPVDAGHIVFLLETNNRLYLDGLSPEVGHNEFQYTVLNTDIQPYRIVVFASGNSDCMDYSFGVTKP